MLRLKGSDRWVLGVAASGQNKAQQAKEEPLAFVKRAAAVANNVQPESINGSLGIYISDQNWTAGLKDGDLGPFLKVKEAKAGRSATCLFTQTENAAVFVYCDGKGRSAVGAVTARTGGRIVWRS